MTRISAAEEARLGEMAATLVPFAEELIYAVREYDREEITRIYCRHLGLTPDMGDEVHTAMAAMVVLAAMADPNRSAAEALAWVTWDERGYHLGRAA